MAESKNYVGRVGSTFLNKLYWFRWDMQKGNLFVITNPLNLLNLINLPNNYGLHGYEIYNLYEITSKQVIQFFFFSPRFLFFIFFSSLWNCYYFSLGSSA